MRKLNKLTKNSLLIFIGLFWSVTAYSSENTDLPSNEIKRIEGVYKRPFKNALINGEEYQSEDIIEMVKHFSDSLYFKIRLAFYNGHSCKIYGIAKYSNGSFIYKDNNPFDTGEGCTLKISRSNHILKITDRINENSSATCRAYCGVRGNLSDVTIDMQKKRTIQYMPIILKSKNYLDAVDEYTKNGSVK